MDPEVARMMADLGLHRRDVISATEDGGGRDKARHLDARAQKSALAEAEAHRAQYRKAPVKKGDEQGTRLQAWNTETTFERDAVSEGLINFFSGQGYRAELTRQVATGEISEQDFHSHRRGGKGGNYTSDSPRHGRRPNDFNERILGGAGATPRTFSANFNFQAERGRANPSARGPNHARAPSPSSFGTVRIGPSGDRRVVKPALANAAVDAAAQMRKLAALKGHMQGGTFSVKKPQPSSKTKQTPSTTKQTPSPTNPTSSHPMQTRSMTKQTPTKTGAAQTTQITGSPQTSRPIAPAVTVKKGNGASMLGSMWATEPAPSNLTPALPVTAKMPTATTVKPEAAKVNGNVVPTAHTRRDSKVIESVEQVTKSQSGTSAGLQASIWADEPGHQTASASKADPQVRASSRASSARSSATVPAPKPVSVQAPVLPKEAPAQTATQPAATTPVAKTVQYVPLSETISEVSVAPAATPKPTEKATSGTGRTRIMPLRTSYDLKDITNTKETGSRTSYTMRDVTNTKGTKAKGTGSRNKNVETKSTPSQARGNLNAVFFRDNERIGKTLKFNVSVPVEATLMIKSRDAQFNPLELIHSIELLAQSMVATSLESYARTQGLTGVRLGDDGLWDEVVEL